MEDVKIVNYDNTHQVMPMEYSVSQDVSTCPFRACLHGGGGPQLGVDCEQSHIFLCKVTARET